MKRWVFMAAVLLAVLGAGGFLVAASGIAPITASAGHFAITEWFLQFSKRRSVDTHTLTRESLKLDEPWLVMKGAGHYESGCSPCHGSPKLAQPRVAQAMLPPPPNLATRVAEWEPKELFYIVKHGIKLTGMPAWPSQKRDDEVRAMIAFLVKYAELDASAYERLVYGETRKGEQAAAPLETMALDEPRPLRAICARCHGMQGDGRETAAFPKLAGQRRAYLLASLESYEAGKRHSGIMQPVAAGLSSQEMRELADYYSKQRIEAGQPAMDADSTSAAARGQLIVTQGIPAQRVPSCADCHGPGATQRNPAYPLLAGQWADYLVLQLELFKRGERGGSRYAHLMRTVATRLKPAQMRDVAEYYASLPSTGERAAR
jgi:cytochrome c553